MRMHFCPSIISRIYGRYGKNYVVVPVKGGFYLRRRYKEPCHSPDQENVRNAFLQADLLARELEDKEKKAWNEWAREKKKKNWYAAFMSVNIKRALKRQPLLRLPP